MSTANLNTSGHAARLRAFFGILVALVGGPMVATENALLLPAEKAHLIELIRGSGGAGGVFAELKGN